MTRLIETSQKSSTELEKWSKVLKLKLMEIAKNLFQTSSWNEQNKQSLVLFKNTLNDAKSVNNWQIYTHFPSVGWTG